MSNSLNHSDSYLFTSESVTEGHPDKICDQVADAILDSILVKDPFGRVACEVATTTGLVMVPGEIENRTRQLRSVQGIPVDEETWRQIEEITIKAGI